MGEIRQKYSLPQNPQAHIQGDCQTAYESGPRSYPKYFVVFLQKRLFIKPYITLQDPVEVNLLLHQAIDSVVSDRYPLSPAEATYLASLRAQVVLGGFNEDANLTDYV